MRKTLLFAALVASLTAFMVSAAGLSAPMASETAAGRTDLYYVCGCGPDCNCNSLSSEPGKCKCGKEMVQMQQQAFTRDGTPWVPMYIEAIDQKKCIGCGRCQKVCGHDVLGMQGLTEDGDVCPINDEEMERLVTFIAAKANCIGCNACARVCASKAMIHLPATAL